MPRRPFSASHLPLLRPRPFAPPPNPSRPHPSPRPRRSVPSLAFTFPSSLSSTSSLHPVVQHVVPFPLSYSSLSHHPLGLSTRDRRRILAARTPSPPSLSSSRSRTAVRAAVSPSLFVSILSSLSRSLSLSLSSCVRAVLSFSIVVVVVLVVVGRSLCGGGNRLSCLSIFPCSSSSREREGREQRACMEKRLVDKAEGLERSSLAARSLSLPLCLRPRRS